MHTPRKLAMFNLLKEHVKTHGDISPIPLKLLKCM
jgi:hypothetical protein